MREPIPQKTPRKRCGRYRTSENKYTLKSLKNPPCYTSSRIRSSGRSISLRWKILQALDKKQIVVVAVLSCFDSSEFLSSKKVAAFASRTTITNDGKRPSKQTKVSRAQVMWATALIRERSIFWSQQDGTGSFPPAAHVYRTCSVDEAVSIQMSVKQSGKMVNFWAPGPLVFPRFDAPLQTVQRSLKSIFSPLHPISWMYPSDASERTNTEAAVARFQSIQDSDKQHFELATVSEAFSEEALTGCKQVWKEDEYAVQVAADIRCQALHEPIDAVKPKEEPVGKDDDEDTLKLLLSMSAPSPSESGPPATPPKQILKGKSKGGTVRLQNKDNSKSSVKGSFSGKDKSSVKGVPPAKNDWSTSKGWYPARSSSSKGGNWQGDDWSNNNWGTSRRSRSRNNRRERRDSRNRGRR